MSIFKYFLYKADESKCMLPQLKTVFEPKPLFSLVPETKVDVTLSLPKRNFVRDAIDSDINDPMFAPVGTSLKEYGSIIDRYRDELCPPDPVIYPTARLVDPEPTIDVTLSFRPKNYVRDAIGSDLNDPMFAPKGTTMGEFKGIIDLYRDQICPPDPVFTRPEPLFRLNLPPEPAPRFLPFEKFPGDLHYRAINNPLCAGTGPAMPDPLPPMSPGLRAEHQMLERPPLQGMMVNHPCMGPFAMR